MGRLTDLRPRLATERLRLEPLTPTTPSCWSSSTPTRRCCGSSSAARSRREEVLEQHLPRRLRPEGPPRGIGYWAGFEEERFVGWWSLAVDDADDRTAELGYRLRRDAWGRGLATEGSRALLDHAFDTLGLPSVWAVTMAVNAGSRGVLARLGMTHVRTDVEEWEDPLPGAELGEVRYELTREEWRRGVTTSAGARPRRPADGTSAGTASSSPRREP